MSKLKPYIGINGPSWEGFLRSYGSSVPNFENSGRQIIKGIQASEKTQILDIENRFGSDWYPVGNTMRAWWGSSANRMLHMNFEDKSPRAISIAAKFMLERTIVVGTALSDNDNLYPALESYCRKVQLNNLPLRWADYRPMFEALKSPRNGSPVDLEHIVLQVNQRSLDEQTPSELAHTIALYGDTVSGVLLDGSGGTGIPLNAEKLRPYIAELYEKADSVAVGIAGGLNAATVEPLAAELLRDFPGLSVDAESGLRDNYSAKDPKSSTFSIQKAIDFIDAVVKIVA